MNRFTCQGEFADTPSGRDTDFYYLRTSQENGQWAWTITLGEVSGTVDPGAPKTLSGTILDDDGSRPSPTVLSWTLTLP